MKITKLSLVVVLAVTTAFSGGDIAPGEQEIESPVVETAAPESDFTVSANLALTSNYVWRGMSQTSNAPAVQGGIDFRYKGFYLGTWMSNVDFNVASDSSLEADFYVGYAGVITGIGFDLGYIQYAYPHDSNALNFEEVYVGLSKDFGGFGINGKYTFGLDNAEDYWDIGASVELPMDFALSATYGDYDIIGNNYIISLSKEIGKFGLSVAYTDFSTDNASGLVDEDHVVATISTSF